MNGMQELLGNMFRDRQLSEDEYVNKQDGLVYCRICHTPRQTAIRASDGSIVFCPPVLCDCKRAERDVEDAMREAKRKAEEIESLKRACFRDRRLLEYTFANDKGYNPEIAMAKRYVELFPDMEARGMGLLLWGNVGTGKTFITACIANALKLQRSFQPGAADSRVHDQFLADYEPHDGLGGAGSQCLSRRVEPLPAAGHRRSRRGTRFQLRGRTGFQCHRQSVPEWKADAHHHKPEHWPVESAQGYRPLSDIRQSAGTLLPNQD